MADRGYSGWLSTPWDIGDLDRPLLHQLVSVDYMGYIKVTLASLSFYVSALHSRHLNQLDPFPLVDALSC